MNIIDSAGTYEEWLRKQLKTDFDEDDLDEKHKKMAKDAFQFLRATYWRWAETIYDPAMCPELADSPEVLAVGDIHVENFGTWRDEEGRLIWGVNDFDEAERMPYAIDVVRLATSAVLAEVPDMSPQIICDSILNGYETGIAAPAPFVLDRKHEALRLVAVVSESERKQFWKKFDPEKIAEEIEKKKDEEGKKKKKRAKVRPTPALRAPYRTELESARPDTGIKFAYYARTAGTGSLGRPRYFGVGMWQGDYVIREAKAIVRSGWALAHDGSLCAQCEEIARGPYRCPDPTYRLRERVLVRRLSPNDFKIEAKDEEKDAEKPKAVERPALVNAPMLQAMGQDLASIHRGTDTHGKIKADLEQRRSGWLFAAAQAASENVNREFEVWKKYQKALPDADD
jgi:hypothetical protein